MSDTLGQPFPSIPAPFVRVLDNDGNLIGHGLIEQIWLQLLIALWQRTGGAQGVDSIEALLFAVSSTDASVAAASQAELSPLLQQTIEREVQRFVLELSPRAADASLEALLFVDAGGMAAAASAAINISYDDSGTGLGTNVQDAIDALFAIASGGGSGNVVGPAGAVANDLVLFIGATGLIIKDSNVAITTDGTLGGNSDGLIATEKAVKTYVDAHSGVPALALIQEVITSASQSNVTFSAIVATYRDLEINIRARGSKVATDVQVWLQFNGDTGANYNGENFNSFGTSNNQSQAIGATQLQLSHISAASAPANSSSLITITIGDYRGTTFEKPARSIGVDNNANASQGVVNQIAGGKWKSTAAINSIKVFLDSGNFVDNSVVSLYGRL